MVYVVFSNNWCFSKPNIFSSAAAVPRNNTVEFVRFEIVNCWYMLTYGYRDCSENATKYYSWLNFCWTQYQWLSQSSTSPTDNSLVVELGNEMANSGSLRGHFMVADEFQPDIEVSLKMCELIIILFHILGLLAIRVYRYLCFESGSPIFLTCSDDESDPTFFDAINFYSLFCKLFLFIFFVYKIQK